MLILHPNKITLSKVLFTDGIRFLFFAVIRIPTSPVISKPFASATFLPNFSSIIRRRDHILYFQAAKFPGTQQQE